MVASLEHLSAIVDQIDYDFSIFTIEDFADWVATRRGKPIVLQPWGVMPKGVFGLWLSSQEEEYIYYYNKMPPILKLMTLLHELSHIYLDHRTLTVTNTLEILVALVNRGEDENVKAMARDIFDRDSAEDREAETMALVLLGRVLKYSRSNPGSSSPGTDYLNVLGVS